MTQQKTKQEELQNLANEIRKIAPRVNGDRRLYDAAVLLDQAAETAGWAYHS